MDGISQLENSFPRLLSFSLCFVEIGIKIQIKKLPE